MGSETKRTISIAIGVAAGILLSGAIAFAVKVTLINMAAKELAKQIEETNRQAKSEQIQRTLERIKADRRKALYEEMRKKESSDACRFWRQQKGINDRAEQKIKEHCYTGPDPRSL
jgi:uncharacterized membrane protein YhiD involved in acid resistance